MRYRLDIGTFAAAGSEQATLNCDSLRLAGWPTALTSVIAGLIDQRPKLVYSRPYRLTVAGVVCRRPS